LIGFELPKDGEFTIRIYDHIGSEIHLIKSLGKAGYNKITLGKEVKLVSGVYFYWLESGDNTATRKMIFYR
jgi:hypothetical protein